jgi:hypothetical protein
VIPVDSLDLGTATRVRVSETGTVYNRVAGTDVWVNADVRRVDDILATSELPSLGTLLVEGRQAR